MRALIRAAAVAALLGLGGCAFGAQPPSPELALQTGHEGPITDVAYTPDGGALVSGGIDGRVKLWDPRAGRVIRMLAGAGPSVLGTAASPDGSLLAAGGDNGRVSLWDARTGEPAFEVEAPPSELVVVSLAFAPRGRLLLAAAANPAEGLRGRVAVWPLRPDAPLRWIGPEVDSISAVAVSPDEDPVVVAAGDSVLRLLDLESGEVVREIRGHSGRITAVAFSPDGRRLASASTDGTVRVWDRHSGTQLHSSPGTEEGAPIAFTPSGAELVVGGTSPRIVSAATGDVLHALRTELPFVSVLRISPDGRVVTGLGVDPGLQESGSTLFQWDAASGALQRRIDPILDGVRGIAFLPGGRRIVTADADRRVRIWDLDDAVLTPGLTFTQNVGAVAASPVGSEIALGLGFFADSGRVVLWDPSTQQSRTIAEYALPVSDVTFSPDGSTLTSVSDAGVARISDVASGETRHVLEPVGSRFPIKTAEYSPDGSRLATGGFDRRIRIWDPRTGAAVLDWPHGEQRAGALRSLSFSPDGRLLASASPLGLVAYHFQIWDPQTGSRLRAIEAIDASRVEFLADTILVAGRRTGRVTVWNPATGRLLKTLGEHELQVTDVAVSPDGRLLASAADDNAIHLYELPSGRRLATLYSLRRAEQSPGSGGESGEAADFVIITPDGFYTASPGAEARVSFRVGTRLVSAASIRERYFQPERVRRALRPEG